MNEDVKQSDLSLWFSTYGILTSQRVLEGYDIHLKHDDLISAIKNPNSIYYQLLRVPLKNVFNGIILQQVHDYQVYAQKIFIDFLVTGQSDKEEGSPGTGTREDLEEKRTRLIELGERYSLEQSEHQELIAESQSSMKKQAQELKKSLTSAAASLNKILRNHDIIKSEEVMKDAIQTAMVYYEKDDNPSAEFWEKISTVLGVELDQQIRSEFLSTLVVFNEQRQQIEGVLASYIDRTEEVEKHLKDFRTEFYDLILRVNELVKILPDYKPNPEQEAKNKSALNFDAKIGEHEEQQSRKHER